MEKAILKIPPNNMKYCQFCKKWVLVYFLTPGNMCKECGRVISDPSNPASGTSDSPFQASVTTKNGMPNLNAIFYD
jgi:hypothetical protein